jgi:alkylation response protein AidB-like acyl-CoA dehydrogenase
VTAITAFTQDQGEIRGVARQFLEREAPIERVRDWMDGDLAFTSRLWEQVSALGWPGIAIAEERGGAGYGFLERAILLEEMGRALTPLPFLASAGIAADALAAIDSAASRPLLEELASGEVTAALVAYGDLLSGPRPGADVRADVHDEHWTVTGHAGLTLGAPEAGVLLVVAAVDDALGLFSVLAQDADRRPVALVDATRPAAVVSFDASVAIRLDEAGRLDAMPDTVTARAAIGLAAEMIGGAQQCLEMTLAYVKDREQFGAAIGSFQALKHRLADVHVVVDSTRELIYGAARVAAAGDGSDLLTIAAGAKAAANKAYLQAAEEAIQMHGGIGFTWEHDAHLFYKRALVDCEILGSSGHHLARVAAALGV